MGDLIRRQDAQKAIVDTHLDTAGYAGMAIARIPAADAVPRDEHEALLRRFRHLLQSDFIRSFDEVDPKTGTYKRDISEADKAEPVRHGKWEHVKKHMWRRDKHGEIDTWAMEFEFHNGPICEVCGDSTCIHCSPDWENEECEIGYFICSECKQATRSTTQYCPHCGAKMDGDDHA